MGKVCIDVETNYEVGNYVVFRKDNVLLVGIIEGYYYE